MTSALWPPTWPSPSQLSNPPIPITEYGAEFKRVCAHDGIRHNEPSNWTATFEYQGQLVGSRRFGVVYKSTDNQAACWYALDWLIPDFRFDSITLSDSEGRLIATCTVPSGWEFSYSPNCKGPWIAFDYQRA